ncbi:MAG TPA: rhodanese-like domain-containing protein [Telluria sp.]|nr:rhodanese-like domain-containing protein [Telluria sp.]
MKFIIDNIFLVAIAAISGFALMLPAFRGSGRRSTPTEVTQLINRGKTTILDVRDAAEYANGHLRDAKHIPLGELSTRIGELGKSKDKTVVVVCQRGSRADRAVRQLAAAGFTDVTSLDGGITAWQSAGLPVAK